MQSEDRPQVNTAPMVVCPLCSGHRPWKCGLMKAKSPEERKTFVQQAKLCKNCLGSGHMAVDCRSKLKYQVNECGWKHHIMLHIKKSNNNSTPANHPAVTSEETRMSTISGAGETGMSPVSRAGNTGQYGKRATGSWFRRYIMRCESNGEISSRWPS